MGKREKIVKGLWILFRAGMVIFISSGAYADLTKQDIEEIRKIVKEGITIVKDEVQTLRREVQKEFGYVNQRIDNVNQRMDDVEKSINRRIEDVRGLLYVILADIFVLVGFVLWDRRTALASAVKKASELEEREERIERALKEFALKEPRLAESLRYAGIT